VVVLFVGVANVRAQNLKIDWFSVGGGGGRSAGGSFEVIGTIGQLNANVSSGGNFSVASGFWGVLGAVQTPGAPRLTITLPRPGEAMISWTPGLSGFVLQESVSLSPANWSNVPGGATNPVTVPVGAPVKFYRLFKQ
jgi:hypothetical protein